MEKLVQIENIEKQLKVASRSAIGALYRLVFQEEGDRKNRSKLREFSGFTFSDDSPEFRDKLDYASTFSVGDLTSICNILGLDYSSSQEQLGQKIIRALMDINSLAGHNSEDDTDLDGDDEDENGQFAGGGGQNDRHDNNYDSDEGGQSSENEVDQETGVNNAGTQRTLTVSNTRRAQPVNFSLGFKDVEDSIREFDGSDSLSVERWVAEFEDAALLFEWSDLQKVVFAKRSIKGLEKLFIQGESGLVTWKKLKTALLKEFSTKLSSTKLHSMLAKRKIKDSESVQEYFLVMRELASRGKIECEALIEHVIEGLGDDPNNKAILYDAQNLDEFKIKLKTYEKIRNSNMKSNSQLSKKKDVPTDDKKTDSAKNRTTRCFNCGKSGHISRECKSREKGTKCFKCNKFGHIASNCKGAKTFSTSNTENRIDFVYSEKENSCYKEVVVEGETLKALIDTESALSLIREDVFEKFKLTNLRDSKCKAVGFGGGKVETKGSFQAETFIDNEAYNLDFDVVSVDSMPMKCIIGRNILPLAEVRVDKNGVKIIKCEQNVFIGNITLTEKIEIDVGPLDDDSICKQAEILLISYKPNKTKTTDILLTINLIDDKPIYSRPRRLPIVERDVVDDQVEVWEEAKIIKAINCGYASPIVLTKKKDGTYRVCVDYRRINKVIIKDKYPIPLIEDLIDALKESKIFSTLDLKNGFFHVSVSEESQKYTSFVTHKGQYAFLKAPFGLCVSPAVFQRFINCIFRPLINKGIVCVYFDDIILLAKTDQEAIENLKTVLTVASDYGLEINKKKCHLLKKRIEYLGQVIEDGKIYPSPGKILAVTNFPKPKSIKDVQSFIGLTGYF